MILVYDYAAGAAAVQPFGVYSSVTVVAQVHPADVRVRVMVLPNTGPGALAIVQTIVPAPVVAVPDAAIAQLEVDAVPPIRSIVGFVP